MLTLFHRIFRSNGMFKLSDTEKDIRNETDEMAKLANGISGRVLVQCEGLCILQWNP